jgi:hypothetical protein
MPQAPRLASLKANTFAHCHELVDHEHNMHGSMARRVQTSLCSSCAHQRTCLEQKVLQRARPPSSYLADRGQRHDPQWCAACSVRACQRLEQRRPPPCRRRAYAATGPRTAARRAHRPSAPPRAARAHEPTRADADARLRSAKFCFTVTETQEIQG